MPNFKEMSLVEVRQYVLANRQDKEAWKEFKSRPRENAIVFSADTSVQEIKNVLQAAVKERN